MNSADRPMQRRLVGTDGPSVEALLDQRVAVVVLSMYVLAALVGVGVLAGALVVFEWPRLF